ncbi:hypothetical protein [Paenibacillus xylanexedens]|uniref:hypothetical protein n=1 Tax=Paenibacillus xylanexedens TaxID=528191 RepID=UPI0011A52C23|nr:hypothetical protein [Paenibacillus xylanexedens]
MKQLNLIWVMSSGVDLGENSSYLGKIRFVILREMFIREINDNPQRNRDDLIQIALSACKLRFHADVDMAERIIENMMWSTSKNFVSFSFEEDYFDDANGSWSKHRFQYFELDRDASDLENEFEIYKLSSDAIQIVLSIRELEAETDITLEQMIAEMMIKRGNLREARATLDRLDVNVRKLIYEEKEHLKQLKRNPRIAIYEQNRRWNKNLKDIEEQFNEERRGYARMINALEKVLIAKDPDVKKNVHRLMHRIHRTSKSHDYLAKLVIGNIRTDFEYRSNHFITMFWSRPKKTFKESIWKNATEYGFQHPDALYLIANSIFSPQKPFLFPLEWIAIEQNPSHREVNFAVEEQPQTVINPMELDWDRIVDLWAPLISLLLDFGEISTSIYQLMEEDEFLKWVSCREAFDIWMLFKMNEDPVLPVSNEGLAQEDVDHKLDFLRKLISKYPEYGEIANAILITHATDDYKISLHEIIEISPITIQLNWERGRVANDF